MTNKTLPPKESRLSIRASGSEKALLAQAAKVKRMNTSQFVLQSSLEAAEAVLSEKEIRYARMRRLAAEAMSDPGFVEDMRGTMRDFRFVDAERWPNDVSDVAEDSLP
jgi:uncharacterized protein (DUF1778 family)